MRSQPFHRSIGAQKAEGASMTYPPELDTDDIEKLASYIAPGIRPRRSASTTPRPYPLRLLGQVPSRCVGDVARSHSGGRLPRAPHRRCHTPPRCNPTRVDGVSEIHRQRGRAQRPHALLSQVRGGVHNGRGADHRYFRTRYTCPRCGHGTDGPPPIPNKE
jgi:hypothetical protein